MESIIKFKKYWLFVNSGGQKYNGIKMVEVKQPSFLLYISYN